MVWEDDKHLVTFQCSVSLGLLSGEDDCIERSLLGPFLSSGNVPLEAL